MRWQLSSLHLEQMIWTVSIKKFCKEKLPQLVSNTLRHSVASSIRCCRSTPKSGLIVLKFLRWKTCSARAENVVSTILANSKFRLIVSTSFRVDSFMTWTQTKKDYFKLSTYPRYYQTWAHSCQKLITQCIHSAKILGAHNLALAVTDPHLWILKI